MSGASRGAYLRRSGAALGLALALCATCEPTSPSRADDPPPPPPSSAIAAQPAGLDPSVAALGASVSAASEAIADGRFDDARAAIAAANADDAGVIRFRLARAYASAGSVDAALPLWNELVAADHPLALAARIELGHRIIDPEAARAAVEPACLQAWPGQDQACAVLALVSGGLPEEETRLTTALDHADALGVPLRTEVTLALATLLAASEDEAVRERAIELLRSLGDLRPGSPVATDADTRADAIVASLPAARRRALATLGTTHALARADALARTTAHDDARRAYHDIAEAAPRRAPVRCTALLGEGRAMYRARERALAAERLDAAVSACGADTDALAWALYFAAKSYAALGHDELAVARYDTLAERATDHRLADDARYEAAAIELRAGNLDAAREHLRAVIDGPADADMRPDALFLLGWTERRAGALDAALVAFDEALASGASDAREDLGGRSSYWRARTLADLDRTADARAAFETLARERPLSYYGRHARGRLVEQGVTLAPLPLTDIAPTLTFASRPASDAIGFARSIAALRAGEVSLAERELDALGLTSSADDEEDRWLAVALLARSGASQRAIDRTRGTLVRGLLAHPLDDRTRALLALAYPRGYSEEIETGATDAGIPSALVFGLVREESSFGASAVSGAHAYGLMQLIGPTARRLARPLGLPSDASSLVRPDVNVRLGTRYLAELSQHYPAGPEVIPAAYNAGQGAVDRWLRERGEQPLDEFVESIPYAETRGYTRRVIQSWGIYSFLATGRIEWLGHTLPHP